MGNAYLKNRLTGSLFRVLGTTPSTRKEGDTTVWIQKADQPNMLFPWSADSLMNGWHWYVAVDEHGQEQEKPQ